MRKDEVENIVCLKNGRFIMKLKQEELLEKEPHNPTGSLQDEKLPSVDQVTKAISRLENESQSKPSLEPSSIGGRLQEDLASRGIYLSDEEIEEISMIT